MTTTVDAKEYLSQRDIPQLFEVNKYEPIKYVKSSFVGDNFEIK